MKRYLVLIVVGIASAACSEPPFEMNLPQKGATLSLIAGGLGGLGNADDTGGMARLNFPYGAAADNSGNLYVADSNNHIIRKVVLATGQVTTLAGSPGVSGFTDGVGALARFQSPLAATLDGTGNLYIADAFNHTIRKLVLATGQVTTLAGAAGAFGSTDGIGPAARFTNPSGVATDTAGNVYVADLINNTIRKIVTATGQVTTLAGTAGAFGSTDGMGAAARFFEPRGVAADNAGNLYVAENNNSTIRKIVTATGQVTTLAGVALMYGTTDGIGTAARFRNPNGIAADNAGNLYVAEISNSLIRQIVIATGQVTTLAGTAGMLGHTDGVGTAAQFNRPFGVAADSAGNVYIADTDNSLLRKLVVATRAVTTLSGTANMSGGLDATGAAARFNGPGGGATDGAGNFYVADTMNHTVRKIVLATGVVTTIAGSRGSQGSTDGATAQFNRPSGLAADGAGNLYVADASNSTIRKIVIATGMTSTLAGTAGMPGSTDGVGAGARFNTPYGVVADKAGNLYVADNTSRVIRKIVLATGTATTVAGTAGMLGSTDGTGPAAQFKDPRGIAVDDAGNLYVADTGNHIIRKVVLATGVVMTFAGAPGMAGNADGAAAAARFSSPNAVATDSAGNLYVADGDNATVRRIEIANRNVTTIVGLAGQRGVKLGPPPTRLSQPNALTMLPGGELLIIDKGENAILSARL